MHKGPFYDVRQVLGCDPVITRWLKLKEPPGSTVTWADGVTTTTPGNLFAPIYRSQKRRFRIRGLRDWVSENRPELFENLRYPPTNDDLVTSDLPMLNMCREMVTEAVAEKAPSSESWKLIERNVRAAWANSGAPSSRTGTPGNFLLTCACAFTWHSQPRRVVASETLGLIVLERHATLPSPDHFWVRVLADMDYKAAAGVVTRNAIGADAKLHQAKLQYKLFGARKQGKSQGIVWSFSMSDTQSTLADRGKLQWVVLTIWWAGLFIYDILLIPVQTCLVGENSVVTRDDDGKYSFQTNLHLPSEPTSRLITNRLFRHQTLLKWVPALEQGNTAAFKFVHLERRLDRSAAE